MKYYVYAYLDPRKPGKFKYGNTYFDFEPFYIGKGQSRRKYFHLWSAKQGEMLGNPHKYRKILNIIGENLEPIIVEVKSNMDSVTALKAEQELISLIGKVKDKKGPLTNITDGGESNPMDNPDIRERIRKRHLGAKRSAETRKKLSDKAKERKVTADHKEKISQSLQGNCRAGRKVICTNVQTGDKTTYPSVLQASKALNIHERTIYNFIKHGNSKNNVKGWEFE